MRYHDNKFDILMLKDQFTNYDNCVNFKAKKLMNNLKSLAAT